MKFNLDEVFHFNPGEEDPSLLRQAVEVLPLKKMGLEQNYPNLLYHCTYGTFNSIIIRPKNDILHSIWIPKGATNVHSTEEYQGFRFRGVDYFIYRRPEHHIKKYIAY